jgi:ABC-type uncharacterized transport system involved in gliding motility auxiliary subunit
MSKKSRLAIVLFFAFAAFLGVNMLARQALVNVRLDVTDGEMFTLSDATRTILKGIEEPLKIRFFFSEEQANGLPVFQAYAERIRAMLARMVALSGGAISVEFFNPSPFTEEEDLAVAHGLQGVPVDDAGTKFYFGMSVENTTDDRGIVPFFDPAREGFLEYDVTRLIHDVAHPRRKKIGLISSLPMHGVGGFQTAPTEAWQVLQQMRDLFEVEVIGRDAAKLPEKLDVLMLVHPYNLSPATLYAIDQYALSGGKLLVFLDAHLQLSIDGERSSSLEPLLSKWGVALEPNRVAAEKEAAIAVTQPTLDTRLRAFPNVTWLEMDKHYLAKDSVITASLSKLRFIESGYFTRVNDAPVTMEPLVSTTTAAMSVDATLLKNGGDPLGLFNGFVPDGKALVLAAQLTGNVESAFPEEAHENKEHVAKSTTPLHALVVGDSDLLRDEIWVQSQSFGANTLAIPDADNGTFVLNAIEYLTGDNALIALRSRGTGAREFTILAELKKQAEQRFSEKERQLKEKLKELEGRMHALQTEGETGKQLFTPEQEQEIRSFREAFMETRKELRGVQRDLNRDIERLGANLALMNIALVPSMMLVLAFVLPTWMRRRRRGI